MFWLVPRFSWSWCSWGLFTEAWNLWFLGTKCHLLPASHVVILHIPWTGQIFSWQLVFRYAITSALKILLSVLWQTFTNLSSYCNAAFSLKPFQIPSSQGSFSYTPDSTSFILLLQYLEYIVILTFLYVPSLCLVSFWSRGYFYILNI